MRPCRCHARCANTRDLNDRLHVALWVSRSQAMAEEKGCTMMARKRGAAMYVRVSTDKQTVENQVRELRQIAERRGWEVVAQFFASDAWWCPPALTPLVAGIITRGDYQVLRSNHAAGQCSQRFVARRTIFLCACEEGVSSPEQHLAARVLFLAPWLPTLPSPPP
jgi:Resolvase, N terminal domain